MSEGLLLCMLYGLVRWISLVFHMHVYCMYVHCVGTDGDDLELLDQAVA